MFVQALASYADRELSDQLNDEAWESKPVPYYVAFDSSGKFLNIITNNIEKVLGKKTVSVPAPLTIPRSPVPRNAGLYPLLAADDIKYVLGIGSWTVQGQEENHRERHEAFVELIRKAATEINDEGLQAAVAFYNRPDQVEMARQALAEAKAGAAVALALVLRPLVKRDAVRRFWSDRYAAAQKTRVVKGGDAECLISGKIGPIAPTHEKIKGLVSLGGQASGVSLMSFDKEAFCSYGWDQNANSPVSPNRAMAYVLALNDLLKPGSTRRRDIARVGFVFWLKKPEDFDAVGALNDPDQIQRLFSFDDAADPDPNMFYMAGVAGNGGRMLVRYWVAETLSKVKANYRSWFDGLQIADAFTGAPAGRPFFWQLLRAIDREGEPPSDRVISFLRRAIEGPERPLGYRILSAALSRLRVAKGSGRLDPSRAGLIRLCLNDQIQVRNKGERPMTTNLDTGQKDAAYLCGRLMAIYESLQYTASKEVNNTVADRYYSLASTYPALAFPKMADLGRAHLKKLRRDNFGAMVRISKELDELHLEIEAASGYKFPAGLDLDGQGRFVLGYHHQRAYQMLQAQAAKKSKQENTDLQGEETE